MYSVTGDAADSALDFTPDEACDTLVAETNRLCQRNCVLLGQEHLHADFISVTRLNTRSAALITAETQFRWQN